MITLRKSANKADGKSLEKRRPREVTLVCSLVGANPAAEVKGLGELPGKSNYFIGNDSRNWQTNVPLYAKIQYGGIYPGVNMIYYDNQRQLEYDFVVAPGSNYKYIRLAFKGAEKLEVNSEGDLMLYSVGGVVRQRKPFIYQEVNGIKQEVVGGYKIRGKHEVGFDIPTYDASKPLVIDPVLVYSTYLGGSSFDSALGIAVDGSGNTYITGITGSTDFPTSANSLQRLYGGGYQGNDTFTLGDAFVVKLNSTGSELVYSTYLGGNLGDEGHCVKVDASGNVYVAGATDSTNFPASANAAQRFYGGSGPGFRDAFVAKLNATGSQLIYSTYVGGSDDDSAGAIAIDASANAYITGITLSSDFPTNTLSI